MINYFKSFYVSRSVGLLSSAGVLSSYLLRHSKINDSSLLYFIPYLLIFIAFVIGVIDKKSRYTVIGIFAIIFGLGYLLKFIIDTTHHR